MARRTDFARWRSNCHAIIARLLPEGWLAVVLIATLLKGLIWSAAIPVGQGPDEPSHVALVQFIGEQHRLPQQGEVYRADELKRLRRLAESDVIEGDSDVRQSFSSSQLGPNELEILALDPNTRKSFDTQMYASAMFVPPLYHWLASLPYHLVYSTDVLSRVFAMRLTSVLLMVGLVWVSYWVARESFPARPRLWQTVTVVVSFQPMATFLGAVVNSDILLFLLLALATWLIIRAVRRSLTWGIAVGLGVVTGLGLLTKPMILAYGLGLVTVLVLLLVKRRQSWSSLVVRSASIMIIALSISGWFLLRNQNVQGSALYDNPYDNPHIVANLNPKPALTIQAYWRDVFRDQLVDLTFLSYWGKFGWMDTPMPDAIYEWLRWVSRLASAGICAYVIIGMRRRHVVNTILWVLIVLIWLSVSPLLPMFGRAFMIARDAGRVGTTAQGRYLLSMWAAQATLLVFGLTSVLRGRAKHLAYSAISLFAVVLNVVALFSVVIPRYYQ